MWVKDKPKESGYYWFYGDPFWDQLPRDNGKNPFKPELCMIECTFVREGFVSLVTKGTFVYKIRGLFWDEKIESPQIPSIEMKDV